MSCSFPTPAAIALDASAVLAERTPRAVVRVEGPDRSKFLHNLTTNEVKSRPSGSGFEAFVTSLQGRTLGLVTLLTLDDAVLLRTEADALPALLPHLGKYGILEDVSLDDQSLGSFELHLAGPRSAELLRAVGVESLPEGDLDHLPAEVAGASVRVVREGPLGRPGFTVIGRVDDLDQVRTAIEEAGRSLGLVPVSPEAFDALRIEAGTPESAREVTDKNLPQELARDSRAISFTKGCYLGQETVARLDALGHVNRLIRGLVIEADAPPPPPGSQLLAGEKEVGRITSSAVSERTGRPIALGFVRTSHVPPGSSVVVRTEAGDEFPATVSDLPIGLPRPGADHAT